MNQKTASNRINTIRERVREQAEQGMLSVVAAKARVSEGMLYEWLEDCAKMPSHDELVSIQDAVGEQITLPNSVI